MKLARSSVSSIVQSQLTTVMSISLSNKNWSLSSQIIAKVNFMYQRKVLVITRGFYYNVRLFYYNVMSAINHDFLREKKTLRWFSAVSATGPASVKVAFV